MKKTMQVFFVVLMTFVMNSQLIAAKESTSILLLGIGATIEKGQDGEVVVKTEGLKVGEGFVFTPKDLGSKSILFQVELKGTGPVILRIEETDARGKFLKDKEREVELTSNWSKKELDFVLESESSQVDVFVVTKEKKETVFEVRNVQVIGQ
ncbi:hypothetical protein [Robertmurraya korlensis]|uniref:hypothetical protein n=1 Tax=Robertmurraya korlensis TaxID=519977 RepID=UPI0008246E19|nr:hypothetical protein [Robertmurraya korlensis]